MGMVQQLPRPLSNELVASNSRDDRGGVGDLEGRTDRREHDPSTPGRSVWVDLGCGRTKIPGFIGVDRFPLPGVDVVADLDRSLPFASDSVDLVYACHSLEHIADLSKVIREIYRVCKHGAQICIIAPYYQQGLNLANPYHKQVFNEHTPRFWTTTTSTPIDPAEYFHPHASSWGLLESDNRSPDIDIRCVNMEFFYFPEYRDLPSELQRRHRQYGQDVCDQMVYHLLVHKQPTPDDASSPVDLGMELFESPYIEMRRLQERCERLEARHREAVEDGQRCAAEREEALRSQGEVESRLLEATGHLEELTLALSLSSGRSEQLAKDLDASERENRRLRDRIHELEASRADLECACAGLGQRITSITSRADWQALQSLRCVCDVFAPRNTLRRRLIKAPLRLIRAVLQPLSPSPEETATPDRQGTHEAARPPLLASRWKSGRSPGASTPSHAQTTSGRVGLRS